MLIAVSAVDAAPISRQYVSPSEVDYPVQNGIVISYHLDRVATVTTTVMDSNHYRMKVLEEKRKVPAGVHTIVWDGRDEQGRQAPPNAYYFTVKAVFEDGSSRSYNPAFSGGEYEGIIPITMSKADQRLSFFLAKASRVRIRAGIQRGPLKKTLVEWGAFSSGEHFISWDGYDESGSLVVWDDPYFVISATGFTLPPHSMVIRGEQAIFNAYWNERAAADNMTLAQYLIDSPDSIAAALARNEVMENTLAQATGSVSNFYFTNSFNNTPPNMDVFLGSKKIASGDVMDVTGPTRLVIDFPESTKALFLDQRYEILMYIDDKLVMEDETGYTPYSWVLDPSHLAKGDHILTINIATLNDKVGAWSHRFSVR
jgi:hypothetical protein